MVVVERKDDNPLCTSYSHTTKNLEFFFKTHPQDLKNIQLNDVRQENTYVHVEFQRHSYFIRKRFISGLPV